MNQRWSPMQVPASKFLENSSQVKTAQESLFLIMKFEKMIGRGACNSSLIQPQTSRSVVRIACFHLRIFKCSILILRIFILESMNQVRVFRIH
jgi:hypothetical protein